MDFLLHLNMTYLTQILHKIFPIAHSDLHLFELFLSVSAKHCSNNFICTTLNLLIFYTCPCVLTSKKEVSSPKLEITHYTFFNGPQYPDKAYCL